VSGGGEARERAGIDALADELVAVARALYGRGWMEGTSGNASVRSGREHALITASGRSKGRLTRDDTVLVAVRDGAPATAASGRPSAETAIHVALYAGLPACGAVVHAHCPYATAFASRVAAGPGVALAPIAGYELIKGLGLADPRRVDVPVFPNWPDVARIAGDVSRHLRDADGSRPPVLLIAHHGATAWGADLDEARDRLECLEALCRLDLLVTLAANAGAPARSSADGGLPELD
jgi:methylthioribulose-1-phosphate dehydratase